MAESRKKRSPSSPSSPSSLLTMKHVMLTWRSPLEPELWIAEPLDITAFNISSGGALALFHHKSPVRVLAAGYWSDLTVIEEEPLTGPSDES